MHTSHSFKIAPPFFKSWLRAWMDAFALALYLEAQLFAHYHAKKLDI